MLLLPLVMSKSQAALNDGDTFEVQTVEGINMKFKVLSEAEKTCEVAPYAAIDNQTAGSVTIPSEANGYMVISIGNTAFSKIGALSSVTIPNTVTTIGGSAFHGCSGINSITIPNSVTIIGDMAFRDCSGLTTITIPNNVSSIGYDAFYGCSNLTSVKVGSKTPVSINSSVFETLANKTLYVPTGSKAAYQNASYWKDFAEIVEYDEVSEYDFFSASIVGGQYIWTYAGECTIPNDKEYRIQTTLQTTPYDLLMTAMANTNFSMSRDAFEDIYRNANVDYAIPAPGTAASQDDLDQFDPTTFTKLTNKIGRVALINEISPGNDIGTSILQWTLTAEEALNFFVNNPGTDATAKDISACPGVAVKYESRAAEYPDFYIIFKAPGNATVTVIAPTADVNWDAKKNNLYWYAENSNDASSGKAEIHVQTLLPEDYYDAVNYAVAKDFDTRFSNAFIGNNINYSYLTNLVVPANGDFGQNKVAFSFIFDKKNNDKEYVGVDGKTYVTRVNPANAQELQAGEKKTPIVYTTIAQIALDGVGQGINHEVVKWLKNVNEAEMLLNAKSSKQLNGQLNAYIGLKAVNDCGKELSVNYEPFAVRFLRPINAAKSGTIEIVDNTGPVESHVINLRDLVKLTDWRDVLVNQSYWGYYDIQKIEIEGAGTDIYNAVYTNLNQYSQETFDKLSHIAPWIDLTYNPLSKTPGSVTYGNADSYGTLTYRNYSATIEDFDLKFKVRVTYNWGYVLTDDIVVHVYRQDKEHGLSHGDIFEAQTVEGINMKFRVLSAAQRTCEVAPDAISYPTTGSVSIPSEANGYKVISIGRDAFSKMGTLSSVTIPNSIMTIDNSAFYGCSGLTSITIPNSVTTIGDYAFYGCTKLADVYCHATQVPSAENYTFSKFNATLHVPTSALHSYMNTAPWSNFATIVPIKEEPTEFAYDGNVWHVGGSCVAVDFKSINDAMQSSRVKDGDILFVEEGSSIPGMQYVTKSVKIMGPGFSVKAGEKTPPYYLQNGLSIEAPHVTIDGLGVNGNVTICDNYATVQHCCVRNLLAGEDFECTDAMINANFIGGYINAEGGEDWTVNNNVVYTVGNTYSIYGEGLTLNHNNIYNLSAPTAVEVSASSITNNVIINKSGKALESHDAFANERNILSDDPNNNFPNNTYGILSLEDVFNHRAELVYQNMYWYVLLNSIAYQYGNDGKDCGAYGYKVRPSELPIFNPITVPETTTDEKKLTISVYAMRDDWLGKGIDALEYFWDFDPGWGQATPITGGTPVKDYGIDVRNFVIDCSNLAVGRHTLVVRARSGQLWAVSIHQVAVVEQVSGSTNHYVLNKTATEAPSQYLYNSLESLFNAMAHYGLAEQMTVDVVDNTYEMEIPTMRSWHSATTSGIDAELSALESDINYMNEYVGWKENAMQQLAQSGKQLTMTASQYATFNFKITTAADYQTLRNKIDDVSKSIPTLSTSLEEHAQYTAHLMAIETRLNSFVEQWKSSLQTLISKVTTENISIIIDGATYRYGIEDMIDPNDLLALRVISQYLNVGNYWNFANNGREQDDFPGVTFIDHRVTGIDLSGRGLEGELNCDWNPLLPELTYLNLSNNAITGDLTPFVQDMPKLKTLTMNNNRLTAISGKLPASLSSFNVRSQWRQSNTGSGANQAIYSWTGELTPMVAYISPSTDFELPTLFTYNPNSNNNSLHPDLQVVNPQSPTTIYGTYTYNATAGKYKFQPRQDSDYTLPQDAEVALTVATQNTAQWWSAYPAMLRFVVGDANMDGMVSVLDVQQTLNYILATVQPFNYTAANTYSDQTINVQDIVCTVNILLGLPNTARTMKARQSAPLPDETVEGWIYEQNERIVIAPKTDVAALDIELEGVGTDEVSLLLNCQQFQMIGRNTENGSRYIIFSPTGHVIPQDKVTALLALSRSALPIAVTAAGGNACEVLLGLSQPTGISDVMSQDSRRTVTETWLAPGIYIISTTAEDGTRTTVKVLKKTK